MAGMRTLACLGFLLVPSLAAAHVTLTYPPARATEQKAQVCGAANSVRGTNITTLEAGATITVTWLETIDHPGHYRVGFDLDGQDFPIPATATTDTTGLPNVIQDMIPDLQGPLPAGGRPYSFELTLPNMPCDNCTLQLTQLMTDKPPYTTDPASNDIYYQCADIRLVMPGQLPDAGTGGGGGGNNPDAGTGGGTNPDQLSGGCAAGGGALGLGVGLALLGLRRRRAEPS
jgi:hypothetical protein